MDIITPRLKKSTIVIGILIGVALLLGAVVYRDLVIEKILQGYRFLSDKGKTSAYIESFGAWAPLIFMVIQLLQVIFAPVPGEMTGVVGGYLFGTLKGFVFSSIALTAGSIINFAIGKFFGRRFVRSMIPAHHLARFDALVRREGALVIFILFIFPGFPKDYLCLFLGLSALPFRIFVWLSAVGRMPGTFILSLQGSMISEQNHAALAAAAGACCLLVLMGYRYREALFRWIERQNKPHGGG